MSNPYLIEGPAVISFSGGRTSGYMLRQILDVGLQPDVHVLFADTGKEMPATYDFVDEIEKRWDFELHRVERPGRFEKLIADKRYLPNPVHRLCTEFLKVRPMKEWMIERGYDFWENVIGLRADEPARVSRMRAKEEKFWDYGMPLAIAGITEADVLGFWSGYDFDLQLRPWESNCDLCFLKGKEKKLRVLQDHPETGQWWIDQEEKIDATFRKGQDYKSLVRIAKARKDQISLPVIGGSDVPVFRRRVSSRPPGSAKTDIERKSDAAYTLSLFGDDDLGECLCTD